ncbi:hypothetical protein ADK70_10130 [Streptomyces rimosus subsp. pseudoverticillatus]|uniref:hypothetical protein n=1 Tax=Streptomyces rimosus TaxID=1927 RepID=UPI0006C566A9|nr:hypothetical protein [Streptomyces rimosus]KOT95948.1 hypothetical protein ADK70_10130 [Streptomyces rimosus subsp. pseudoverticillatus]
MRSEVLAFVADGPLPDWDASEEEIDRRVRQLEAIVEPVTDEEARDLASCFGPDDCFGVAGSLLHLIETAPNPVLTADPGPGANEWVQRLYDRAVCGGLIPDA